VRRLLTCALRLSALACRDAFAEVGDVVVADDERPGQHGLEGAGEAPLGTPCQVVVEVAALGPLREPGDVIRVVLIAHDPDGLAPFVLEALAEDFQQQAGDIAPAAGLGKQLVGDQGAHQRIPLLFPVESMSPGGNAAAASPAIRVISVAVPRD
jgi:hypothetical protein